MTLLDFLSQHTGLVYWTMILTFLYSMGRLFTAFAKANVNKFPDPGKGNTYVTNNYWPGAPQEFVDGGGEPGVEVPTEAVDIPQNKDIL